MVKQIPLTLKQFCAQLTDHDLIGQQDLSRLLQQCESAGSDDECLKLLAKLLIRESPLTLFQMQQVYAGKTASLFLKSYIIEGKLGDGGKGMVLKARHRHMDRHVAIKVLSPKLTKNADLLKRFRREMKALAALDHPNIVSAYDAGEARGIHFLVMQYVDGQDLSSLVKRSGPLSPAKTLDYLIQGCHGLRYAHERGILNRDVKPANILLGKDGVVRLLECYFGTIKTELEMTDHQSSRQARKEVAQ